MSDHTNSLEPQDNPVLRTTMKKYWEVYQPSLESMMLSNDAKYLAENEQNEIISYLPPYKGAKILELGAGIGRFTGKLAVVAGKVCAVDFMDSYIKENEKAHKDIGNIDFICADVMQLDFPSESFDIVFSNWLLMYLSDAEVQKLMKNIMKWLKPSGNFFFRESCYHPSGNLPRPENPTNYRTPIDYSKILFSSSTEKFRFNVTTAKSVLTYIHAHGNPNQLCILAKVEQNNGTTNSWLESMKQLNLMNLKDDESFETPLWNVCGGELEIKNLGSILHFRSNQSTFCIGCNTGDLPIFLAKQFSMSVYGIEDSIVSIHNAIERQDKLDIELKKKIQFEFSTLDKCQSSPETFDHIFSLDLRYQIQDANDMLERVKILLKPEGNLIFTTFVSQKDDQSNYISKLDLEKELKRLGLKAIRMKSDKSNAITWINSLLQTGQSLYHKDDLKIKMALLQNDVLDWMTVIARKH